MVTGVLRGNCESCQRTRSPSRSSKRASRWASIQLVGNGGSGRETVPGAVSEPATCTGGRAPDCRRSWVRMTRTIIVGEPVMLAAAYYERTGDLEFIESIWPNVLLALEWFERHGDMDGDGFVEYRRHSSK